MWFEGPCFRWYLWLVLLVATDLEPVAQNRAVSALVAADDHGRSNDVCSTDDIDGYRASVANEVAALVQVRSDRTHKKALPVEQASVPLKLSSMQMDMKIFSSNSVQEALTEDQPELNGSAADQAVAKIPTLADAEDVLIHPTHWQIPHFGVIRVTLCIFLTLSIGMCCGLFCCTEEAQRPLAESSGTDTTSPTNFRRTSTLSMEPCPGFRVNLHKSDYAIKFPLKGSGDTFVHLSGTRLMYINWDDKVNGVQLASDAFMSENKDHAFTLQELKAKFGDEMTVLEYHEVVRQLLAELLSGPMFGLETEVEMTPHGEEICLNLRVPHSNREESCPMQYAAHYHYRLPLSDKAYKMIGMEPCFDATNGGVVHAHAEFLPEYAEFFQPLRQVDRLRLLMAHLQKYINLTALESQGVISEHFPTHDWEKVKAFGQDWANPRKWFRLPSNEHTDQIRDYFGEEVTWMYFWHAEYTRALLVPAIIGGCVFCRRFFFSLKTQREIQIGFAIFMSIWVSAFNGLYDRREARLRLKWGLDGVMQTITARDHYNPKASLTLQFFFKLLGDLLFLSMVVVSVTGMYFIQRWRGRMVSRHEHWIWPQLAALLIAAQIMTLDVIWRRVSRFVVDMQNHKTQEHWCAAWVDLMFWPRLFNNLYPFVYVGFIKEHDQGCPNTATGCVDELEMSIITYFFSRIFTQIVGDALLLLSVQLQISHDLFKGRRAESYSYTDVQAKSQIYNEIMLVTDWTEQTLTFAFVACFSLVLPAIAPIALLTNLFEIRMVAHRNCFYLRRPTPNVAKGIGAWRNITSVVSDLSVLCNVGFAVFVLRPLRDRPWTEKWIIFVVVEHVFVLLKRAVRSKFPEVPTDIADIAERCQTVVRRTFISLKHRPINVVKATSKPLPSIGPRATNSMLEPKPRTSVIQFAEQS